MIRLQRTGKRGQAYFRVVILEHTTRPKGKYLELLGNYNPHQKQFQVKKDRIEYWISKGAQISPTVNNLMVNYKVWDRPKMQSWKPKTTEAQKGKEAQKETTGKTTEVKDETKNIEVRDSETQPNQDLTPAA